MAPLHDELGRVGAGAGGEQGRVLEQPDAFRRGAGPDRRRPFLHECQRVLVGDWRVANPPLDLVDIVHDLPSDGGAGRLPQA